MRPSAEVDHQDLWQRATLTVALTSGDRRLLESQPTRSSGSWMRVPDGVTVERIVRSLEDLT